MFLVCARSFICLGIFLCTHVCMWHDPIRSWTTSQLRPSLWTRGRAVSTRPRKKMGHTSAGNMRMSVKKDILLRASTRNTSKSPDKGLVVGVHARSAGLRLRVHRTTWRTWACAKLQSLCDRFRVGDESTHPGVNSWPFRYRACAQTLLVCLRVHFREVWITGNKKTVSILIVVFFQGIFSAKFWFNRTSKIGTVEDVKKGFLSMGSYWMAKTEAW